MSVYSILFVLWDTTKLCRLASVSLMHCLCVIKDTGRAVPCLNSDPRTTSQAYRLRGLQVPLEQCHSTRSVSTSWAAMKNLPLSDICAAATWTSTFVCFLLQHRFGLLFWFAPEAWWAQISRDLVGMGHLTIKSCGCKTGLESAPFESRLTCATDKYLTNILSEVNFRVDLHPKQFTALHI